MSIAAPITTMAEAGGKATRPKKSTMTVSTAVTEQPPVKTEEERRPPPGRAKAVCAMHAATNSMAVMAAYADGSFKDGGELHLVDLLMDGMDLLKKGDMATAEEMLIGQAHALQTMFSHLSCRSLQQNQLGHMESFMRMAFKAQNQCRMTLETLATIKNPPVVFAKQANVNNGGQQQINNEAGSGPSTNPPRAETAIQKTELLETSNGQWLDTGAQGKAGGIDSHMETVGAINRAQDRSRKSAVKSQRLHGRDVAGTASPAKNPG